MQGDSLIFIVNIEQKFFFDISCNLANEKDKNGLILMSQSTRKPYVFSSL